MTRLQKAYVGGIGGVCLALLKLVDAKFYLVNYSITEMIVGYLSYGVIIVLGIAVATFFTDDDLPEPKASKNAFILGILAPSLLTAILTAPVQVNSSRATKFDIPKIGLDQWLISSAYAAPDQKGEMKVSKALANPSESDIAVRAVAVAGAVASDGESPDLSIKGGAKIGERTINPAEQQVIEITKKQFEPSIKDAWLKVMGRKQDIDKYALVVGRSSNEADARKAVNNLTKSFELAEFLLGKENLSKLTPAEREALLTDLASGKAHFVITKPVAKSDYFVTVGNFTDLASAKEKEQIWKGISIEALKSTKLDSESKKTISAVLSAQVIPGAFLAAK